MTVYRPTAKAIKKGVMTDDDRLWLRGDGSALMWKASTKAVVQSDVLYRQKDSHIMDSGEPLPEFLIFTAQELMHLFEHKISCPVNEIRTIVQKDGQLAMIIAERPKQ